MIKLGASTKIEEISKKKKSKTNDSKISISSTPIAQNNQRPEVVDAKVYKLKSAFVKNSFFITLS